MHSMIVTFVLYPYYVLSFLLAGTSTSNCFLCIPHLGFHVERTDQKVTGRTKHCGLGWERASTCFFGVLQLIILLFKEEN